MNRSQQIHRQEFNEAISELRNDNQLILKSISQFSSEVENWFKRVEIDLEGVKMRLDNVPYRFELEDLEKKVNNLQ